MVDDILAHDERLRLEALAQSVDYHAREYVGHVAASVEIVDTAADFESYIKFGKQFPTVGENAENSSLR